MRHAARGVKLDDGISRKVRVLAEVGRAQPRYFALICQVKCRTRSDTSARCTVLASISFALAD
jgi:hypothetical protein